ncbi:sterol desaturase family protein [Isoalcanivorax indicus]|uniref:sterol desaturase family protein n=1 Tax=Isoalcanivorax indicus TaxID=2202653 RepID=UPI000DB96CEE|nr:sterol desaturase family protein [Isoalcanivorax indicus]
MGYVKSVARWLAWPVLFFGFGGAIVMAGGRDSGVIVMLTILAAALGYCFLLERLIPYQPDWNRSQGDIGRDVLHALVNLTLNRASLWLLPVFAILALGGGVWPHQWPYLLQVLMAVLILDAGIAMAHHASHRFSWLWRFHAVHHSPGRLYGLNGLMKHPVHQSIEVGAGVLPLLLLGIPFNVAIILPFLASIALLCQHMNADIRTGPLRYLFANAEVHRFHHRRHGEGDINFGLFTNLYDHVAGTFHYRSGEAPRGSHELGLRGREDYPKAYLVQLLEPFRSDRRRREP